MTQFSKTQLRLAFTHHTAQKIIAADRHLHEDELATLRTLLPKEDMVAAGLVEAETGSFTRLFEQAVAESFLRLADLLDRREKLELLRGFVQLGVADGADHPMETAVMRKAWQVLGEPADSLEAALGEL